ncbi:MAG: type II secretion system protein [Candidatus Weimeria sp.]
MKKKYNDKGFTLVELIIVIAIIGCLVSLLVPVYLDQLANARTAKNKANAHAAAKAAETAYVDYEIEYGGLEANSYYTDNTLTYTYFVNDSVGVWNFIHNGDDRRWVIDGSKKYYADTDLSNWKAYTQISDGIPLGKRLATIWTIHMDPSTGQIVGYYAGYPNPGTDNVYKQVIAAIRKGDSTVYGGVVAEN